MAIRTAGFVPRSVALWSLVSLSAFLLARGAACAQEAGPAPRHSLRPGAWALEFGVQPTLGSSYVTSAGISLKRLFSERSAIRFGVLVDWLDRQSDGRRLEEGSYPPYRVSGTATNDYDRRQYSVYTQFQRVLSLSGRTSIHLFSGPTVSWYHAEELDRLFLEDGTQRISEYDYDSWNAGLELGAGFEWFWTEKVSLGAHYGVIGQYGEYDRLETYHNTNTMATYEAEDHGKEFNVITRGSFLKLAAYF